MTEYVIVLAAIVLVACSVFYYFFRAVNRQHRLAVSFVSADVP